MSGGGGVSLPVPDFNAMEEPAEVVEWLARSLFASDARIGALLESWLRFPLDDADRTPLGVLNALFRLVLWTPLQFEDRNDTIQLWATPRLAVSKTLLTYGERMAVLFLSQIARDRQGLRVFRITSFNQVTFELEAYADFALNAQWQLLTPRLFIVQCHCYHSLRAAAEAGVFSVQLGLLTRALQQAADEAPADQSVLGDDLRALERTLRHGHVKVAEVVAEGRNPFIAP